MNKWATGCIWVLFAGFSIVALLLSGLLPPVRVDELVYHLVIPQYYLANGGVTEMPWNIYSYFPGLMEHIYAVFLKLGVTSPQIVHCVVGIGCCWLTKLLAERFGLQKPYQWVAVFSVLLTPEFFKEMTWAYVDLLNVFFWTLGFLLFLRWAETRKSGDLIWMGAAAAGACCVKYTSLIYPLILSLLVLLKIQSDPEVKLRRYFKGMLGAGVVFAVLTSWWWVRNWMWTGNPFFPFLDAAFNSQHEVWGAQRIQMFMTFVNQCGGAGDGNLWDRILTAPQLFLTVIPLIEKRFDGIFNIWFLVGFASLVFLRRDASLRALWVLLLIQGGFWVLSSQQTRFALVTVPFLAVAAAYVVQESNCRFPRITSCWGGVFVLICLMNTGVLYSYFSQNGCFSAVITGDDAAYLKTRLPYWQVYQYIHQHTAEDAVIGMVLTGAQVYYLEREYRTDTVFEEYALVQMIKNSSSAEDVVLKMRDAGWDYMLTYLPVYQSPVWLEETYRAVLPDVLAKLIPVYSDGGYVLFRIPHATIPAVSVPPGTS